MKALLATHNQGKIKRYQALFADLEDLELVTLADLKITAKVDEPFATARENSIHKAKYYGQLSGLATIAIDEAVQTNFLPDNEQPGVFVRRFKKDRELTDEEVLLIWQEIFTAYPQTEHQFIWDFSLSYYDPVIEEAQTASAVQINTVAPVFSTIINPGYPMSSFLMPLGFEKPYAELTDAEKLMVDQKNLAPFVEFVAKIVNEKATD